MNHCHESKVCFLRVPKTGSTAMRRMLGHRYGKLRCEVSSPRGSHVLWHECSEEEKALSKGYLHIGAVRNPIEWLRSFYVIIINNRHLQRIFLNDMLERSETFSQYMRKMTYTPCDWWDGLPEEEQLLVYRQEESEQFCKWLGIEHHVENVSDVQKKPEANLSAEDYAWLLERFEREYRYYPEERAKVHLAATGGAADRVCALSDI